MLQEYPNYAITARTANPDVGWTVEIRFFQLDDPIPGVSEEDMVNAVRTLLEAQPDVNVRAFRCDVANNEL